MEVKNIQNSFYGWYLKCQSETQTLAMIPAVHQYGNRQSCSLQFITETEVHNVTLPENHFYHKGKKIVIGENYFGEKGIILNLDTPKVKAKGKLKFGPLSPLKYDVMGPFAWVPFLECRHNVWSMKHLVCGDVCINGQRYCFRDSDGYWEGDQGRSFPKKYIWAQCCFKEGSLMLSVADIPIAGFHFNGIICIVLWKGKEYRLATYLGAHAARIENGRIRIVQGDMELEACLLEKTPKSPLAAPVKGNMVRTIHESAASKAFFKFRKNGNTLFALKTTRASFEYEYPVSLGKS